MDSPPSGSRRRDHPIAETKPGPGASAVQHVPETHLLEPPSPHRLRVNILHSIVTVVGNDQALPQDLFPPGLHCIRISFPYSSTARRHPGTRWSRWHVYDVIPDLNLAELFLLHWGSYEPKRGLYLQEISEPPVEVEWRPALLPRAVYRWDGPNTLRRVAETGWSMKGGQVWLSYGFERETGH